MNSPYPAKTSKSEGVAGPAGAAGASAASVGPVNATGLQKRRSPNKPSLTLQGKGPEKTDATQEVPHDETSEFQPTPPFGRDSAKSDTGTLIATAQQPTGKPQKPFKLRK